jgi:hypothetical protein
MHTRKDNYPQAHRYNIVVALHQDNPGFNIEPKGKKGKSFHLKVLLDIPSMLRHAQVCSKSPK